MESRADISSVEIVHYGRSESAWGQCVLRQLLLSVEPWGVLGSSHTFAFALVQRWIFFGSPADTVNVVNVDITGQPVVLEQQLNALGSGVRHTVSTEVAGVLLELVLEFLTV